MLERIYHLRLTQPHWEGPKNIHFNNTMRNNYMQEMSPNILEELCDHSSL